MAGSHSWEFKATKRFWKAYEGLTDVQREKADAAFEIFQVDPWDQRLGTHKINRLSALMGCTVYSVCIAGDLRSTFVTRGEQIWSLNIGTHAIYEE